MARGFSGSKPRARRERRRAGKRQRIEVAARRDRSGQLRLVAGDEIELQPELDRVSGGLHREHELDVVVQAVDRVLQPERVAPDRQRLLEAVDVLGEAQLRDVPLRRALQIAEHVLLGVELGRAGVRVVGTEMCVVVGEHHARAASSRSARRSSAR